MEHKIYKKRSDINTSQFFDLMLENSQVAAMVILDQEGFVLDINQGVQKSLGYTSEDIVGKHFSLLFTPEDKKLKRPEIELVTVKQQGSANDNNYVVHKSGAFIWCHGESIYVKAPDGQIFFIKLLYDINAQKLLEKFLVASNDLAESIIEKISAPLVVLDENARVIKGNISFFETFFININELDDIKKHILFEFNNGQFDTPQFRQFIQQSISNVNPQEDIEVEFIHPSLDKLVMRVSAKQLMHPKDTDQKLVVIFTDITSHRKDKAKLSSGKSQLHKINLDLDTFVYTASHDLKAPISNIEALIDTLISELPEDYKSKEEVILIKEMLNQSIEKFKTTINDLANVGKAKAEENSEQFLLFTEIFEEVKVNLAKQIEDSKAIFIEDFSRQPDIAFSRKNLRSVLQNLVSNAIKYSSPERRPEVKLKTKKVDSYILLEVTDNGLGIKEEDKSKVFSMYKRLHNHVEGTGVGLSIVSQIVDNAGGKIEIESEVGKGSTFKIFFKD